VPEILHEILDHPGSPRVAGFLLVLIDDAERSQRRVTSFPRIHSRGDVLFDLFLKVEL
jgi:hypothetical protein